MLEESSDKDKVIFLRKSIVRLLSNEHKYFLNKNSSLYIFYEVNQKRQEFVKTCFNDLHNNFSKSLL